MHGVASLRESAAVVGIESPPSAKPQLTNKVLVAQLGTISENTPTLLRRYGSAAIIRRTNLITAAGAYDEVLIHLGTLSPESRIP
jgi:hypothetical protein